VTAVCGAVKYKNYAYFCKYKEIFQSLKIKKMIRTLILAAFMPAFLYGYSNSHKFDLTARQQLSLSQTASTPMARSGEIRALPANNVDSKTVYLVTFTDSAVAASFAQSGYDVLSVRDEISLVSLSADEAIALSESPDVVSISLGYENKTLLVDARASTGVDAVHAGKDLPMGYTGKGVVCGMMDIGLDVNHINFLSNGEPRVERMWVILNGAIQTFSNPDKIKAFTVDTSNETHGTHVLGIMAGGYKGKLRQATYNSRTGRVQVLNENCSYYGVAPEAVLAPCCGNLQDNNILLAAENILKFAKEKSMPAVMNLSLGHNIGPHDGTTAGDKYLAQVGKEMVICVSAGNEAGTAVSYHKDFSNSDKSVKTFVSASAVAAGLFDVWANDATAFDITFVAYDKVSGSIKYSYKVKKEKSETVYITGSRYTVPEYIHDPAFDAAFGESGAIVITNGLNPDNNRYNVFVNLQLSRGADGANIIPGFIIEGSAGKSVDMYVGGGLSMTSNGITGYVSGNDTQSINDMACGDNIIAVGAYVNAAKFPTIDVGELLYKNMTDGEMAPFSSYGKNFQGRQLPDITGPGMGMRSSYSHYFLKANPKEDSGVAAKLEESRRNHSWLEMSGTSMSSPFVAGVCALWLQADPTLTVDDIKAVMKETADKDEFTAIDPERWGYGKINALAGIKKILGSSGIAGVVTEGSDMIVTPSAGAVEVFAAGAGEIRVELYTVGGALAAQTVALGDSAVLSTDGLAKGVYVLRAVADDTRTATRKIAF